MIIAAKFASVCPVCSQRIVPGTRVEWSKGSPARHTACAQGSATPVRGAAPASRYSSGRAAGRGRRTGCACGARELPDGSLSAGACAQCRYDAE